MLSQRTWAWQCRSQDSLTRMREWLHNTGALRQQRTMSFSYRAVSSGRSRKVDLCQRKVSEWHICISKPITKTLWIPFGYPWVKNQPCWFWTNDFIRNKTKIPTSSMVCGRLDGLRVDRNFRFFSCWKYVQKRKINYFIVMSLSWSIPS